VEYPASTPNHKFATGSPACSDTHIRCERQPQNTKESTAHKKAPRTGANPGARHHSLSRQQLSRQQLRFSY